MLTQKMLNELVAILDREAGIQHSPNGKSQETIVKIIKKYEELKRMRAGM
jgi:hypothetical protein